MRSVPYAVFRLVHQTFRSIWDLPHDGNFDHFQQRAGQRPSAPLPPFDYQPLGRVISEAGALAKLGEAVRYVGGTCVLLVTDPGLETAGHPQRAAQSMRAAGLEVFTFDGVKENPTEREVDAGVVFARSHHVDCIVAVGGGSSMDCAKGINFILTNGGRMADYKGHGMATRPMLPSVGVPTTAGTGSEAQSYALITDEKTHLKLACGDKKAAFRVAILDPEVTVSQPKSVTAVTGIDAIAHAVESYVCTKRNPLSAMCSLAAFRHLVANFETVLRSPGDLAARSAMQVGRAPGRHGHRERHARRLPQLRQPAHRALRHHARRRHRPDAAARHPFQQPGGQPLLQRTHRIRRRSERPIACRHSGRADCRTDGGGRTARFSKRMWGHRHDPPLAGRGGEGTMDRPLQPAPVTETEILKLYQEAW